MSGRILRANEVPNKAAGGPEGRGASRPGRVRRSGGVINSDVYDALTKAREIIEGAEREREAIREEAARQLEEARRQAEEILEEARRQAEIRRREGFEEGREEGMAKATELLLAARAAREGVLIEAQDDIIALAMGVARKIIGREVELRRDAIVDIVAEAIQTVRHQRDIVVLVHPEDLAALEEGRPRLMALLTRARDVTLRADSSIDRGGCVIESEIGTIDGRLDRQLDVLFRVLKGRRGQQ